MTDVLAYLHDKHLTVKNADAHNVHLACVFCGEDPGKRGRLYINIDPDCDPPGLYKCHLCGATGNLVTLKRHFGDQINERELDSTVRAEIMSIAATYYHELLDEYPSVAAYLKGPERGLHADTIDVHAIGYAPMAITFTLTDRHTTVARPNWLFRHLRDAGYPTTDILATGLCQDHHGKIVDSLAGMVTIPYHVAGQVVTIRGRTWPFDDHDWATWEHPRYEPPKGKYKTLGGARSRLFGTDAVWGATEIVLCEGECDALVLEQAGFPAIAAPGAGSWQSEWDDYLNGLKRVWLVYDRDPAGERGATKLVERFGSKIRRIFLSPQGVKCDPTTWLQTHTAAEFAELLAEAGKGGLLVTVDEAIDEFRRIQSQPGLLFGWSELDGWLQPGLQPGQLVIVLARTNVGKSLLLMNLMHRVRMVSGQEDKRMLFLSLEQTRGEWWDRARRIYRFYNLEHTETDARRWWQNHIRLVDRNQLSTKDLTQILDDYEYEVGGPPDLICLDYLGYWGRGFKGEAYERMSAAVHSLKQFAKEYRIPWIVPQQVNRSVKDGEEISADNSRDAGTIEETADFLLGMWRPDDSIVHERDDRSNIVNFKILKSRHGGRGEHLAMQWSPVTLTYVPLSDPLRHRARKECDWFRSRPTEGWETTVERHHPGRFA